jgi:hypothetical protein
LLVDTAGSDAGDHAAPAHFVLVDCHVVAWQVARIGERRAAIKLYLNKLFGAKFRHKKAIVSLDP